MLAFSLSLPPPSSHKKNDAFLEVVPTAAPDTTHGIHRTTHAPSIHTRD